MKKSKSVKYTIRQRKLLKKKAWVVFSKWIRQRETACVTCGKTAPEVVLHAGHYCHNREDFNERNIHTQCMGCNWRKKGNMRFYTIYMIDLYGIDYVRTLLKCEKEKPRLESAEFYLNVIEKYS
jgi:hypothetical protein